MGPGAKDYLAHSSSCPRRGEECKDCKELLPHKVDTHDLVCPGKVVDCPHCHASLIRKELNQHIKEECGEVPIECEFKHLGLKECQEKILRKHYPAHGEKYVSQHLKLLSEESKGLKRKLDDYESHIDTTYNTLKRPHILAGEKITLSTKILGRFTDYLSLGEHDCMLRIDISPRGNRCCGIHKHCERRVVEGMKFSGKHSEFQILGCCFNEEEVKCTSSCAYNLINFVSLCK